jgi:hypothetical protein
VHGGGACMVCMVWCMVVVAGVYGGAIDNLRSSGAREPPTAAQGCQVRR